MPSYMTIFENMSTGKNKHTGDDPPRTKLKNQEKQRCALTATRKQCMLWREEVKKSLKKANWKKIRNGGKIGTLINIFELGEEAETLSWSPIGKAILKVQTRP